MREWWKTLLTTAAADESAFREIRFINTFTLTGIAFLTFFGVRYFIEGNTLMGYLECAIAVASVGNMFLLYISGKPKRSSTLLLFLMLTVYLVLMIDGGISHSGILWYFTFPALAFFLKGARKGWWWIGAVFAHIILLFTLQETGVIGTGFSLPIFPQLIATMIAVTILIYLFEIIQERNDVKVAEQTAALQHEITQRTASEQQLADTIDTIKAQNVQLEHTRGAMVNLLEDLNAEKDTLQQQRAKDEALLGSIGDAVFAVDTEGIIILFNPVAATLSGVSAADAMGKPYRTILRFVSSETGRATTEFIRTALTGKKTVMEHHTVLVRKDGTQIPVADSAAPVRDANGAVVGAVVVFRDITQEEAIDKAKTEFVSLASHQLRTPLSSIRWYTELLLDGDGGAISDQQRQFLTQVEESTKRMIALVNSLLNVSRIDLGTMASDPVPTDIGALVTSVIGELQQTIMAKQQTVQADIMTGLPLFNADPNLMRIIVQNLLSNAVKYTPESGAVTITVSSDAKLFHISVADTGYGVPEDAKDKIFNKLYRADNVRDKDTDGNGLGLYLVKSIVETHGGTIRFDSTEGKGTTFYIDLPASGMKTIAGTKTLITADDKK